MAPLSQGTVDLWAVRTHGPDSVVDRFRDVLSPDERDRVERFRFDHLRQAFILGRGALRLLLGTYLETAPASIRFTYGSNGKPSVTSAAGVHFNASGSGEVALFAFTLGRELGVDVERIRPMSDMCSIAGKYFCPAEAATLRSLPSLESDQAFFRCWTRKEAYIKATGAGLSASLSDFEVTLKSDEPARFVHIGYDIHVAAGWALHNLDVLPGYAAALAYPGAPLQLHQRPCIHPDAVGKNLR